MWGNMTNIFLIWLLTVSSNSHPFSLYHPVPLLGREKKLNQIKNRPEVKVIAFIKHNIMRATAMKQTKSNLMSYSTKWQERMLI